jgi:hypothetical protein
MPRQDECEPKVIRALQKDGWTIVAQPSHFYSVDGVHIYPDLAARREETQELVIIEVKCFTGKFSIREEYFRALGQYIIYREVLVQRQQEELLFMSVQTDVYDTLLKQDVFQASIRRDRVKLVIIDMDQEIIRQWIRQP